MPFVQHLSVRVPWHDNLWQGTVCKRPRDNSACVALPEIAEKKQDEQEECIAGQGLDTLPEYALPPCVKERVAFMAPFSMGRSLMHPYKTSGTEAHRDLETMTLQQPPFSATCIPFKWMRQEFADVIAQAWRLDYDRTREPTEPDWLARAGWVQDGRNQRAMLDGFFSNVRREQSLCFFYAKQTPFSDDARRVIVGVGRIKNVGKPMQYERSGRPAGPETPYVWDVVVEHSIRTEVGDGFLMPYAELAAAEERGVEVDWARCLAFSPGDRLAEFSYAAEHVSQDGAIAAMLECRLALEATKATVADAHVGPALRWIDDRISELWKMRGAYPGLGAALTAFGVEHGNFVALHLATHLSDNDDPWPLVDKLMRYPASLPTNLAKLITPDVSSEWKLLKAVRLQLLKLLARFALTNAQATRFYIGAERSAAKLEYGDEQILENPYVLYEGDRFSVPTKEDERLERVTLETIDRGAFPADVVATKHPLPDASRMEGPKDKRRARALIIGKR